MDRDALIDEAVKQAQRRAAETGLRIGQTVAHPDEPIACNLLSVEGETATIGCRHIRRTFPLRELFDPNVAKSIALRIEGERIREGLIVAAANN